MNDELFTVITPTYNCKELLERCIKSIDKQTYRNIEHIVVDGVSNDGTQDTALDGRKVDVRLISEADRGIYDAMNKGIIASNGKYIHILNADDYYADKHVLSSVVERLEKFKVVVGDVNYFDPDSTDVSSRRWVTGDFPSNGFESGWHPCHPGFFCRRSMYERFGCFDTKYDVAADYDLMHRFCNDRESINIMHQVTTWMQNDGHSSLLRNRIKGNTQCWRSFNSISDCPLSLVDFVKRRFRFKRNQ